MRSMRTGKWWMLGVMCLGLIVVSLDLTILNVALPSISASLHAGTADLQWIVDAYALAFAGVMLPAGVIGDRLGRKRVLLAGLASFLVASVWCALADSTGELIAARTLMGLGAAIVLPLSIAIVSATFSDAERAKAIGVATAAVALGLPVGPVLGGLLLQHFSWSSVFWINVPVVALTLAAGAALLWESGNPGTPGLDGPGLLLAVAAIVSLVCGVIRGPERGWSAPLTFTLLVTSVPLLVGFVVRERRTTHPLVGAALLHDRRFTWGTVATIAVSVALFGILFVLPQYLQSVHGYDALNTGLRLLPLMAGLLVAGSTTSPVAAKIGTKLTVVAGLMLLTTGLLVLSQIHLASGYNVVAVGLTLCGLGVGASIAAAMNAVMTAVGGDEAGAGAAVNSTLRQVGGALAVAALGSALSASYSRALHPVLATLPAREAATARESITQAAQLAARLGSGGAGLRNAAGSAFLHGMSIVMFSCAVVALLAALASLRYLPHDAAAGNTEPSRTTRNAAAHGKYATMSPVPDSRPDWRQQKKSATRRSIRSHALRLFGEQGYDATTVEQIAAAAGVSHMTFFRYFRTKEDVVLSDEYDPLLVTLLEKSPAAQPVIERIRTALKQGLAAIYETERAALLSQAQLIVTTPALQARLWADQMASQQLLVDALGASTDDPHVGFQTKVTVAACLGAATTAVLTWAQNNGTPELPELIDEAFDALSSAQRRPSDEIGATARNGRDT